jgi:acyl transferase domain-containing protein/acyl-CoA synthetase (AMP-forming)/AMP-acid ligase II/acyl carrier protein
MEEWRAVDLKRDDLAYLQYTSGSTSTPKGVMVSHGNLMHNSECLRRLYAWTSDSVCATWMPYFHDFGLVEGLVQPLYAGVPCYVLSPLTLLKRPLRWLETISKYGVTHSSGPNFAFDHCVRKIRPEQCLHLDLSRWRVATIGAEPVRPETLDRFAEAFGPCGFRRETFRPAFGLAEATLAVTLRPPEQPLVFLRVNKAALEQGRVAPAGQEGACVLTGCGTSLPDTEVVIVDPETRIPCEPDRVGEIWARNPSVALGYWCRPEESEEVFRARLADGEGPFLRTGDLGFSWQGVLFVTGRLKDLIIIRGQNHYPQDIEWSVGNSHPALRPGGGAAFSVDVGGQERLVVVQEVTKDHRDHDRDEVVSAIRQAIAEQHDLRVHAVVLVRSIPKTSSGKIQRRACRAAFLAGELGPVAEWRDTELAEDAEVAAGQAAHTVETAPPVPAGPPRRSVEEIEGWLIAWIARDSGCEPGAVGVRESLSRLGLDSMAVTLLVGELESWLGLPLSPTIVYEHSTVEALARHLAGQHRQSPAAVSPARPVASPSPLLPSSPVPKDRSSELDPIAIIGLGCRFPGAENPEAFWRLLREGKDAVTEVPRERWNIDAFYDSDPGAPGKMCTRRGGFLAGVDLFAASFFGISPREAAVMDPQQRLVLEVSWEALERAGQAPDRLAGSRTGVFVGIGSTEYFHLQLDQGLEVQMYSGTGTAMSIAANRVSYVLGLQGPSIAVDTACSSSLVAVHLACQSLRSGESDLALAGGVNLMLSPYTTIIFSKARMQAPDGRCKTFDAAADGYVRGEGCGMVVLKRLSDALADGDPVLAVLQGSAVNQDGLSNGLTAPSRQAQQAVIQSALAMAGVEPAAIDYVEAHGTGTFLGDPVEVKALGSVLCPGRDRDQPLVIGSVKTNIGHLETAAGIAGLIKVVLALQHREIPAHLHFRNPNPHIPWEEFPLVVPTSARPWPAGERRRLAGVSSFGFGGTNSHVVVGEAPALPERAGGVERPLHVLGLSARDEESLRALVSQYVEHLDRRPSMEDVDFADLCFTAGAGRSHFAHRLALVAASAAEARDKLSASLAGEDPPGLVRGAIEGPERPRVVFLFTGQGSAYPGMGWRLYETQPAFRRVLEQCDELLRPCLPVPLLSILYGNGGEIDETRYAQPALFALEYALAEMWRSWGIEPQAVLGHSLGEYVAACVAGVFSLEDGLRLVAARGRLMQELQPGSMAAVRADEQRVAAALRPWSGKVSLAAVNGPDQVVISGETPAVEALRAHLGTLGIRTYGLEVSHAFHSPMLEPMLDAFEREAATIAYSAPRLDFISNLTGERLEEGRAPDAGYWRQHARQPVRFASGVEALRRRGYGIWLEVGPASTLLGMAGKLLDGGLLVPSLRKDRDGWEQILDSLARLYASGLEVDWSGFDRDSPRRRVVLPTYPWKRERHWVEVDGSPFERTGPPNRKGEKVGHPLMGERLSSPLPEIQLEVRLRAGDHPFLAQHKAGGFAVVPTAAFLEMGLAAAGFLEGEGNALGEVSVSEPLTFAGEEPRTLHLILDPRDATFRLLSLSADRPEAGHASWKLHASGRIVAAEETEAGVSDLDEIRMRCRTEVAGAELYQRLSEQGLDLGPDLRLLETFRRGDGEVLGEVRIPEDAWSAAGSFRLHPNVLAACMPLVTAALPEDEQECFLPARLGGFRVQGTLPRRFWCHVRRFSTGDGGRRFDLRLLSASGNVLAQALAIECEPLSWWLPEGALPERLNDWLYEIAWRPWSRLESAPPRPPQDFLAAPSAIAERLRPRAAELRAQHGLERYRSLMSQLEAVSAGFVTTAFRRLGWEASPGHAFTLPDLMAGLGVESRFERLVSRLLGMLQEEGVLRQTGGGWEVVATPPASPDPLAALADLARRYPACEAEIMLLERCGSSLAEVLRGEKDALELLFSGGDSGPAERLYRESPFSQVDNALLREAIATALESLPEGRTVRVLEVGAGTGATTSCVLPVLPRERTEYVFTDLSPLFTTTAERKFQDYSCIQYRLLDVEKEPLDQGFAPQQFDLVVAANVLHATRDLAQTLGNLRRLLAPEGMLVLLEGTKRQRWLDLIFGLTEGWWRFADTDLRPSHPLLTRRQWIELLAGQGFTEAAAVSEDEPGEALSNQTVILARRGLAEREIPLPIRQPSRSEPAGAAWVIFTLHGGLGHELAGRLEALGDHCVLVAPGPAYGGSPEAGFTVDPQSPGDFRRLLAEVWSGDARRGGAIYLWGLEAVRLEDATAGELDAAEALWCGGLLSLAQAVAAAGGPDSPRLWVVTRGSQGLPGCAPATLEPAPACLWGMGRVIALELPEIWGGLVDLDAAPAGSEVAALLSEIQGGGREDGIAFRSGQRYVARLVRSRGPEAHQSLCFRDDGTYLITGGLGGLGIAVAGWMVERGARHLALIGRREASPAAAAAIARLEAAGARVLTARVDVAEERQVAGFLTELERSLPPLRGVIHSAGVLADGVVLQQDWERFREALAPKVLGARHLHVLTRDLPLDFFVLFSSAASLLGSTGQANHAAANAFLDALAHFRRSHGLPALSINWGVWGVIGAAAERGVGGRMSLRGVDPISTREGLRALEALMLRGETQVGVFPVRWPSLLATFASGSEPPFFSDLVQEVRQRRAETASPSQEPEILERLAKAQPNDHLRLLKAYARDQLSRVLGFDSSFVIEPRQGFFEIGMDSLTALELRNRLQTDLRQPLPSSLLFDHPSIESLAGYLVREVFALADGAPPPGSFREAGLEIDPLDHVEGLSDEEVDRLFSERVGLKESLS